MRIAVLFPSFLGGGAEAVCAWILEALKEHDVTLVSLSDVGLEELDEQYGTSLAGRQVRILKVPIPLPLRARKRVVNSLSAFSLRQFYLSWYYRKYLVNRFDLAISAFNEMDLGGRGIQYVYAPMFGERHELVRPHLGYPDSRWRCAYKWALRRLSRYSEDRMRLNVMVAISLWTARWVEKLYGVEVQVIYPPVKIDVSDVPWEERQNGFLLIARVVREKRIERAIRIVRKVREAGFRVHLRIVGGVYDPAYMKELRKQFGTPDWIIWEGRLSKKEFARLLSSYKYGIHSRENEQFGIGIAEMLCAGVIPFVPSEGGQVEIIGNHRLLTWIDEEDAVRKITEVLSNRHLQDELRSYLRRRSKNFSTERFVMEIEQLVENFIDRKLRL